MKPLKLNIEYWLLMMLSILLFSCTGDQGHNNRQKQDTLKKEYSGIVGHIPFDPELDDPSFAPCHEDMAFVYHNFGNPYLYEGDKPAIVESFKELMNENFSHQGLGYVTIRFMVSCEGKTGRFRVDELDGNYQKTTLDSSLVRQLLETTKKLSDWIPAQYENNRYDYYRYLTFKIENGVITEILP